MPAITTHKVLVDIPFITPITGKEKIIFSRNGETSFLFEIKKFLWKEKMQEAAAERIKELITKNSDIDSSFKTKVQNISSKVGIDESVVIEAYTDIARKKRLELTTQDLPAALNGAKAIIDETIIINSALTIEKDILLLAETKCFIKYSKEEITESFGFLKTIDTNNLNTKELGNFRKILGIFNLLKDSIPINSDDDYLKKIHQYIDTHIESLSPHLANLQNKKARDDRVISLKKITSNSLDWLNLKSKNEGYNLHLQILDKLNKQAKLNNKEEIEFKFSELSANHLYPQTDILEFALFLEDPNHTEKKLDNASKLKFENFLKFTYSSLPALTEAQQNDALKAIDYLSGILQSQSESDVQSLYLNPTTKNQSELLTALSKNWEQYGPSGFSLDFLKYCEQGNSVINSNNKWNLSYLISPNGRINQIEKNLPQDSHFLFEKKILALKHDLENFKPNSISKDQNKTIIDIANTEPSSFTIQQVILLIAQEKCSNFLSKETIQESLSILENINFNNLHSITLKDCKNILSILNTLKQSIPNDPNNSYQKLIHNYMDMHIEKYAERYDYRVNKIKNSKNKIAVFLKTKISVFNEIDNENAFKAFIHFLEDPTATLKPTREIISNEVLTNKHDKYLENFLAIFAKYASKLTDGESKDLCFDAVDYLTGSLLAAVDSDIRFDPLYSSASEQVELKKALRKNWEQYGPSGFLLHLLNYDKFRIAAIDHRSYLTLNHLLNDSQRIAQIIENFPKSARDGFTKKMKSLKNDLALFKLKFDQDKIAERKKYEIAARRKEIIQDEVEARENLPEEQDSLFIDDAERIKIIGSIKNTLTNFSVFQKNKINKNALTSFFNFLDLSERFEINKNNVQDLNHFYDLFSDEAIAKLPLEIYNFCMKEIDILDGLLSQYKNISNDKN